MNILILGHKRHGKDQVAEYIKKYFGLKFNSSSREALDLIFPTLDGLYDYTGQLERIKNLLPSNTEVNFTAKDLAFYDRHNKRILWRDLIKLVNAMDLTALSRKILTNNQMYVGMRNFEEYNASKHLYDLILYIDAFDRKPEIDESMDIPYISEEMIKMTNNGTLLALESKVKNLNFEELKKWFKHCIK